MNRVWLTGRLTKDPELSTTNKGTPNCQFCIAVNRPVVRDGVRETDFINCIVWNKQAENLVKYQSKGNLIGVQGQFRTDKYEVNGETKYKSYILGEEVEYMESKKDAPVEEKQEMNEFNDMSTKTITQDTLEIKDSDLPW